MRILIVTFLVLFNVGSAWAADTPPAKTAPPAHPALWKLSDADTSIYLFGTIHVLRPGTKWMTDKVEKAVTGAKRFYMEVSYAEQQNVPALQALVRKYGLLPPDDKLGNHLPAEDAAKLKAGLAKLGVPEASAERLAPWFAGTTYAGLRFVGLGYDSTQGVEAVLGKLAQSHGVPIQGLETMEFQMQLFASMTDTESKAFIEDMLKDDTNLEDMMNEITDSWTQGKLEALNEDINDIEEISPSLADKLLYGRNRNWAKQIEELMKEPGTFTIAVGSGHFVGKRSVIDLLQKAGLKVERVE